MVEEREQEEGSQEAYQALESEDPYVAEVLKEESSEHWTDDIGCLESKTRNNEVGGVVFEVRRNHDVENGDEERVREGLEEATQH